MNNKKVKIFGVKNDQDKYIYIGKTAKKQDKTDMVISDLYRQYTSETIKNVVKKIINHKLK
jgi:hypothetical protein